MVPIAGWKKKSVHGRAGRYCDGVTTTGATPTDLRSTEPQQVDHVESGTTVTESSRASFLGHAEQVQSNHVHQTRARHAHDRSSGSGIGSLPRKWPMVSAPPWSPSSETKFKDMTSLLLSLLESSTPFPEEVSLVRRCMLPQIRGKGAFDLDVVCAQA